MSWDECQRGAGYLIWFAGTAICIGALKLGLWAYWFVHKRPKLRRNFLRVAKHDADGLYEPVSWRDAVDVKDVRSGNAGGRYMNR